MKVMVIVKATKDSEAGVMPGPELLVAMGNYNEALAKAGIMLDGAGLTPSSKGARVHFSGTQRTVTDGPFAETKELIAGFWIWRVKSLQEAIDWVKQCPNPMSEDSDIEIRPLFELEDFGPVMTPELCEQEARVRASSLGLNLTCFSDGPELHLAGTNRTYTYENRSGIPQQWEAFVPLATTLPSRKGDCFYGVCWNCTGNKSFDYLTAIEVTDNTKLPQEFTPLSLVPARYAVFTHEGHISAIGQTIDAIWCKWVPECGLKIAQAPCFERYTPEFDPQRGLGGIEIWLPLATP